MNNQDSDEFFRAESEEMKPKQRRSNEASQMHRPKSLIATSKMPEVKEQPKDEDLISQSTGRHGRR
jgi:hypothetical protein